MREILFRGKANECNNEEEFEYGEWSEGSITFVGSYNGVYSATILTDDYDECQVDPETVGQFTGLTDKNGVKIFEGDIVKEYKSKEKVKGVVKFGEYQSGINRFSDDLGFYIEWTTEIFLNQALGYWCRKNMVEVIGNVHDSHDILKTPRT